MNKTANPIPEGYHSLTPALIIRGAARAIDFYQKVFGATETFRMNSKDGTTVLHAELRIGDSTLMLGDESPQMNCLSPQSIGGTGSSIYFYTPNVDEIFDRALKAGATQIMPPTDMFWGDRFGKLQDPFGHQWSIATRTRQLTPEEISQAAEAAMADGAC